MGQVGLGLCPIYTPPTHTHTQGGGGWKILYVDAPAGLWNFDFCFAYLPPISIPISYKNHPILLKLGIFYHNLLKKDPIYVKLGTFLCD